MFCQNNEMPTASGLASDVTYGLTGVNFRAGVSHGGGIGLFFSRLGAIDIFFSHLDGWLEEMQAARLHKLCEEDRRILEKRMNERQRCRRKKWKQIVGAQNEFCTSATLFLQRRSSEM